MKGVILAGGTGSRLFPLTKVTNKHLLPVFNKPMIYYPLMTLINAGIKDIMIVTGGESIGDFMNLLGSGSEWGAKFTYRCQEGSGGIPVALGLANEFVGIRVSEEAIGQESLIQEISIPTDFNESELAATNINSLTTVDEIDDSIAEDELRTFSV